MRSILLAAGVLSFILQWNIAAESADKALDVCSTAELKGPKKVTIRGVGVKLIDGFVLSDITCPVAKSGEVTVATMILVEPESFADLTVETRFRSMKVQKANRQYFQTLVTGSLSCPSHFAITRSDDGDLASGSGYGELGFIKCRLRYAKVSVLEELQ